MRDDGWVHDPRTVLVVEDCDDDFDTVLEAALHADVFHQMVRAVDAEAALSLLAQDEAGAYAFMLLDYKLPGMDGLALLELMCRHPAMAALPTVVFTSSANPDDRDAFRRAGAAAVHVKSVQHTDSLRTLAAIFEQWLNRAPLQ